MIVIGINCSGNKYHGTYKDNIGNFLVLKPENKFEFGIKKYPELFYGLYKISDNSVEIIFRYPFYGNDAVTTFRFSINKDETLSIYEINIKSDVMELKINKPENRVYQTIDEVTKILPLYDAMTEHRLGIFYNLLQSKFSKVK